ncbi:cobalamin B12-binding domain-containing protein [Ramlibacter sp. MMS24-I3-19]|uniref:cobalamin B12-binding domain-containing protein n=1 Tax=Ramlibacter sp. MMS24-I3-19 TaxID=3416606 RepID=UPI003CFE38F7
MTAQDGTLRRGVRTGSRRAGAPGTGRTHARQPERNNESRPNPGRRMSSEQACAVELLRAQVAIVRALLLKAPAFDPTRPHWYVAVSDCGAEAHFHVLQLAAALRFARHDMFVRHVRWLRLVLTHRGLPDESILQSLRALVETLRDCLPAAASARAAECVEAAIAGYHTADASPVTPPGPLQRECVDALLATHAAPMQHLAATAARTSLDPAAYCVSVLGPALHEVGRLWQVNAVSIDQEHQCTARAVKLLATLFPSPPPTAGRPTAICACVVGERHELGLEMVACVLRTRGWNVIWQDQHLDPSGLLREVVEARAQLLALSATMLQHLHTMEALIAAVRAMPECAGVQVLVGGQAFAKDPGAWKEIGADATAADAIEAAEVAGRLVRPNRVQTDSNGCDD